MSLIVLVKCCSGHVKVDKCDELKQLLSISLAYFSNICFMSIDTVLQQDPIIIITCSNIIAGPYTLDVTSNLTCMPKLLSEPCHCVADSFNFYGSS